MNRSEIISQVTSYINQSMAGLEIENSKFDFKRKWYDLKTEPGISEFIKDSSAIANTFGPDGFIVIGYDEKVKQLFPSKFSDSGFNDVSDITNLINKKMDRLFHVDIYEELLDETPISIIHIPPSFDKPHIIKCHKTFPQGNLKEEIQRIFVRNGTTAKIASKSDIELMYWDRKNVVPDYLLYCHLDRASINIGLSSSGGIVTTNYLSCNISIENAGRRSIAITYIKIELLYNNTIDFIKIVGGMGQTYVIEPGKIAPFTFRSTINNCIGDHHETGLRFKRDVMDNNRLISSESIKFQTSNGLQLSFPLEVFH